MEIRTRIAVDGALSALWDFSSLLETRSSEQRTLVGLSPPRIAARSQKLARSLENALKEEEEAETAANLLNEKKLEEVREIWDRSALVLELNSSVDRHFYEVASDIKNLVALYEPRIQSESPRHPPLARFSVLISLFFCCCCLIAGFQFGRFTASDCDTETAHLRDGQVYSRQEWMPPSRPHDTKVSLNFRHQ